MKNNISLPGAQQKNKLKRFQPFLQTHKGLNCITSKLCPSHHVPMELVFLGSSGSEYWCICTDCHHALRYDSDGEFVELRSRSTQFCDGGHYDGNDR